MAEVDIYNIGDLAEISSGTTINNLDNICNELQREINRIKKYNKRKNWVGNKNITYRRRRY